MTTARERNAMAVKKYYDTHSSSIIRQKTLRYVNERGRRPTAATLAKHGINLEMVEEKLNEFILQHPYSNTTKRVLGEKVSKGSYKCSKCGLLKKGHVCLNAC